MSVFLLIAAIVLWLFAIGMLPSRPLLGPVVSFLGLLAISYCNSDGIPWIPINSTMIISWLSITLIVMIATMLQPGAVRAQSRGMLYIIVGGVVGMAIGLLGYTFTSTLSAMYAIMMVATVLGIFFGFMLYVYTPDGRELGVMSRNFFRYLLAKGFPTAITLMQIGLVLVLLIYQHLPATSSI